MTPNHDLGQALRAAAAPVPARVRQAPAQELLEQIVRTDRHPVPAPVPQRRRRLAMAGVAGAIAAAGTFALVTNGPAYASWTPDPSPLSAAESQTIVSACLPATEAGAARVVVGETRGKYAYLNALSPEGSRTCFRDHDGNVQESSILAAPTSTEKLGAEGVELSGWGQLRTDEGHCRVMAGHLGSQITGVDITVRAQGESTGRTIHATVRDGYFLAWYPEGSEEASSNSTELVLRLADGRTIGGLFARDLMENPKLD